MTGAIRLLVADDQALVRGALVALLTMEPDIEVVAEVGRGDEVVPAALATQPDVALLDVEMPGCDGLHAAADLARALPGCRTLIVTTFGRPGYLARALEIGVHGFVVKDTPAKELAHAVREVAARRHVIDAQLATEAMTAGISPLTEREAHILAAAAGGGTIADIARAVFLSQGTVRNYLSRAMGKLEARTRADAVRIASERGWLP